MPAELRYRFSLKSDNISKVDHFAMKDVGVIIKLNIPNIPIVFHHDTTSASLKNLRIELTAPLSVTRLGCGL